MRSCLGQFPLDVKWNSGIFVWVCCVALLMLPLEAQDEASLKALQNLSKAFTNVAKKAKPAVVFITAERTVEVPSRSMPPQFRDPFEDFFDRFFPHHRRAPRGTEPQRRQQVGQGSGFIISPDGYVLTNNHVVGQADKIKVKLHDGRELEAKKVGTDPKSDVAVVKLEGKDFSVLPLGNSDELEVGEWVIAIGNPFGLAETVTVGVVSAKGRSRVGIADYEDFIQTDAAINPGNSGGPLISLQGEAVGINTAIFSRSGGYMGIGFAIPVNMAKVIKDQLVKTGKVTRGFLGIMMQDLTKELAESLGSATTDGILVAEVVEGSPAEKAGFKQSDIITGLGGRPATEMSKFRNEVGLLAPGTKAKITIVRDGQEMVLTPTIGTWSESGTVAAAPAQMEKLGLRVQELTADLAERLGHSVGDGVLVAEVKPGGPAANAGLQAGALITGVNRLAVKSVADFQAALKRSASRKSALLLVKHQGHSRFAVLKWE